QPAQQEAGERHDPGAGGQEYAGEQPLHRPNPTRSQRSRPPGGERLRCDPGAGYATAISARWMPGPSAFTSAWPVPARESARTVQVPGAAENRTWPASDETTSAVNSPVPSSSRT